MYLLAEVLPGLVFIYGICLGQLPAIIPDLFELVVVGEVGIIGEPLFYCLAFVCCCFAQKVFYQQFIFNMVKC